jgi:hypothetical protein
VKDGVVVQVLLRNGLLDNLFLDLLAQLLGGDIWAMLGRNDNGVHSQWNDGAAVVLVLNGDLGLGVGPQPGQAPVSSGSRHGGVELVCQHQGKGEELRSLVGGVSEHDTLVAGAEVLEGLVVVETLSNIR